MEREMRAITATFLLVLASVSAVCAQDPGWPRQITKPQGTLVYYQPQVDDWSNFQQLDWHEAISITPTDGKNVVGAVSMSGWTSVNSESQMVLISNIQVKNTYFPS